MKQNPDNQLNIFSLRHLEILKVHTTLKLNKG